MNMTLPPPSGPGLRISGWVVYVVTLFAGYGLGTAIGRVANWVTR